MSDVGLKKSSLEPPNIDITRSQLAELQHFIELGRLSATLLHEISNPLTAALLQLDQADGKATVSIRQARRSLGSLRSYVEAARQQLSNQSEVCSAFCIYPQFEQLKRLLLPLARLQRVQLVFENIPHYRLYGDTVKFQQIVANLVINAVDAYKSVEDNLLKPVRVTVEANSESIIIKVTDWGEGISSEQLSQVFELFYTTKHHTKHGVGIGLAIVKQFVINEFRGSIKVTSSHRQGTQFALHLPAQSYPSTHLRKKS